MEADEVCPFFLTGACKFGKKCSKSHTTAALASARKVASPAPNVGNGMGVKPCVGKSKCKMLWQGRCTFKHTAEEIAAAGQAPYQQRAPHLQQQPPPQQAAWGAVAAAPPPPPNIFYQQQLQQQQQTPPPVMPAAAVAPPPMVADAADLFLEPGRRSRPTYICVVLRGLPGSGKSRFAKLVRDMEKEAGGSPPRIL